MSFNWKPDSMAAQKARERQGDKPRRSQPALRTPTPEGMELSDHRGGVRKWRKKTEPKETDNG